MRRPRRRRHWTLRSRLALTAVALTAVGLLVANTAGLLLLDNYLLKRVDRQLTVPSATAGSTAGKGTLDEQALQRLLSALKERDGLADLLSERFGAQSRIYFYAADGARVAYPAESEAPGPVLPSADELAGRTDGPFTVRGESGSDWRVNVRTLPDGGDTGVDEGDTTTAGGDSTTAGGDATTAGGDTTMIVTAVSLAEVEAIADQLLLIDAAVLAAVLALLGLLAALLVRLGLRPLTRMEATAQAIAAGDYTRRVADTDPHTEPGRLGRAVNTMLARVESEITARTDSEHRLRRFLADASHELRTPLTSIRGFAELARRGGDPADALHRIEAESARMAVLVDELLLLARLDEQRAPEHRLVDLRELATEAVGALHAAAPGRVVHLRPLDDSRDTLIGPLEVSGDPLRLRQVLGNLLANADLHTPPDAVITVRLGATGAAYGPVASAVGEGPPQGAPAAVVEVADTGDGVPPEHAPYVFERLYRAGTARNGAGAGLGLSIAAAVTRAHGGRLELRAGEGEGAVFRVVLPRTLPG
ncbi:sensor histidine kinase [Streptomyces mesophilus]|uniref:sensor histidine kinase n=1 Tax=Streptomyces mesophilus TaxID=1775132 RepID=UPI003317D00E